MTASNRLTFFRQSGWMVIATTLGGAFMWLVHIPAQRQMPTSEYGVYQTMLQLINLMLIPAMGLQTVFAQQTAAVVTEQQQRCLAWTVRRLLLAVSVIWLAMAGGIFAFLAPVLAALKIANPGALWATVGIALAMLWWPILQGVLQGRQEFLWMGWLQIVNGAGRFVGVLIIVSLLGYWAAGAMVAAVIGMWATVAFAAWHTRSVWLAAGEAARWRGWFAQVVPLTLGLGASQFMMAADQIAVQNAFDGGLTGSYGAAGMIARALVIFTGPMVAVMFPKAAAAAARAERTDVLAYALGATVLMGGLAALGCTVFPELPLRIVSGTKYVAVAPLVPWFAWCMLPLTLSNVLIGNLLARKQFAVVPWLVAIAATYGLALWWRGSIGGAAAHDAVNGFLKSMVFSSGWGPVFPPPAFGVAQAGILAGFKSIVLTLGTFSLLLLGVSMWFTWRHSRLPGSPSATPGSIAC